MFFKHVIKGTNVLGGKLLDHIIRYETQGRGSVHAHVLVWLDVDSNLIDEEDEIHLSPEIEDLYKLVITDQVTGTRTKLYDDVLLNFTNANIWALHNAVKIAQKLRHVDVENEYVILCYDNMIEQGANN